MKKIISAAILATASLLILAFGQTVSIPDPGLNAAIRSALQIPAAPLTEQDLLQLRNLNASHRNVRSTVGLEAAPNLASLNLEINPADQLFDSTHSDKSLRA